GVPGVGQKTAAKLLAEHGSLAAIYDGIASVKGKLKDKLLDHRAEADLSRQLVALRDDVDVAFDPHGPNYAGVDAGALRTLYAELEMTRLLGRVEPARTATGSYATLLTREALERAICEIVDAGECALESISDIDDTHRCRIVGVGLSWAEHRGVYLPLAHRYIGAPETVPEAEALELLRPLLENSLIEKHCPDIKREILVWARQGVTLRGGSFDAMLTSYLVDPERHGHDLVTVARAELGADLPTR